MKNWKTCKTLTTIIGWVLFVQFVSLGFVVTFYIDKATGNVVQEVIVIVFGILLGIIDHKSAWVLYGFGQMIDDMRQIKKSVNDLAGIVYENHPKTK